jgi:hypothetical protein
MRSKPIGGLLMALDRQNPLSIEAVGSFGVEMGDTLKELITEIEAADQARHTWIDKQRRLLAQRRGVRRPKNIPWPGCNNDNWPLIDGVIRRWKPGIANLVLRANPVANFLTRNTTQAQGGASPFVEGARSAQQFYHWLFIDHIDDSALQLLSLVDMIAQHGKAYTRQGWDYRTERESRVVRVDSLFPQGIQAAVAQAIQAVETQNAQLPENQQQTLPTPQEVVSGALFAAYRLNPQLPSEAQMVDQAATAILEGSQYVRLTYQKVVRDRPSWAAVSPLDVILPSRATSTAEASFVAVVHRLSSDDILRMARDGFFDPKQAADVAERVNKQTGMQMEEEALPGGQRKHSLVAELNKIEGMQEAASEFIPVTPILEIYCKIDINGDGIAEKVVAWYHPGSKTWLQFFEYPYPFREWPIVDFWFEYNSDRPYGARGIAELLSSHQKQTNIMHNARLDAAQIVLAPTFKVRTLNNSLARNLRFRPGGRIPVSDPTDIEPLLADVRPLNEFFKEEQFTKGLAEQYVGIFDPSITQNAGPTGRERRTATEIDAVVAISSEVQSQDAQLFQLSMARVHRQIWDLWEEFGQESTYFRVTGEEQPRLAIKADLSGDYDIVPAGSPISTNRAIILQRAREMLQLLGPDQTGLINKHRLFSEYLSAQDYQLSKTVLRDPEEAAFFRQVLATMEEVAKRNGVDAPEVALP